MTVKAARRRFSSGGEAPLEGGDAPDPAIDGRENPDGLWAAIAPSCGFAYG